MARVHQLTPVYDWKSIGLDYVYKGKHIKEEAYLTVDLEQNQIVVAPTCGMLLASQPGETCNLKILRADAVLKWNNMCKSKSKTSSVGEN
jgi:hypothetical protein